MRRALLTTLALLGAAALAQGDRPGSRADVTLRQAAGGPLVIEVETEAEVTGRGELMLYLFPRVRGSEHNTVRRIVAPVEPGLYRAEVELPGDGVWGFSLRYGSGLDLYYGFVERLVDSSADWRQSWSVTFRGGLEEGVPRYVQPAGFAVFGVIAALTLGLIGVVLRSLRARGPLPPSHGTSP